MTSRPCDCPSWLDEEACHEWRRLHDSGLVKHKDPDTIATYCFVLTLWNKMRSILDRLPDEGPASWMDREGTERSHPALAVEAGLAADLLDLSEALDLELSGRETPKPSRVLILD